MNKERIRDYYDFCKKDYQRVWHPAHLVKRRHCKDAVEYLNGLILPKSTLIFR